MSFQSGISDVYPFEDAIDNYVEAEVAVFPNRGWYRCAYLSGLNLNGCGIGVTPTAERVQLTADTTAATGALKVDFELRAYSPYNQTSVAGRGIAAPRNVNIVYASMGGDDFDSTIREPALGAPFTRVVSWAPGRGGGKDDYKPVADALNDMGIVFTCGDYADTGLGPGAFETDTRAAQYREFTEGIEAALGYQIAQFIVGGHSGGCNTVVINIGMRHLAVADETPEVLPIPTVPGAVLLGSIYCSSQAVDGATTPFEDSYATVDPTIPALNLTGEYDLDRKFHESIARRQVYDESSMPAALRYALWGFHPAGTFTGKPSVDSKSAQDWLVKDYYINLMKAWCDWLFYGNVDGRNFILNGAYRPLQIISVSEARGL